MYYIVKYTGPFGYIKPWTAVRDKETFSLQFLTPSIIMGIEKKLFPELLESNNYEPVILRHRLRYSAMILQQETVQAKSFTTTKGFTHLETGVLERGVLLEPQVFLAFSTKEYQELANTQHICLARNEDLLYPVDKFDMQEEEFEKLTGFELKYHGEGYYFPVGINRYSGLMDSGYIHIEGNPVANG